MLCLLYHEARKNVLSGRYPFTQAECDTLAGLQILITAIEQVDVRVAEPIEISPEYFRSVHH